MKKFAILLMLVPALVSCSHSYYASNVHNVPVFTGKNELSLAGAVATGLEVSSGEVQMAYSVTDHLGIGAAYMHATSGDVDERDYSKENYFEAVAGYYEPVNNVLSFGFYGGAGSSSQHHEYSGETYDASSERWVHDYQGYSDVSYIKYFLQPQFGYRHKYVQLAVATRLSMLDFNNIRDFTTSSWENFAELKDHNHLYLEPSFTVRVGGDVLKFQFQALWSANIENRETFEYHDPYHFSFGAFLTIPTGGKKEK